MKIAGLFPRLDRLGGIEAVGRLAVSAFAGMRPVYADAASWPGKLRSLVNAAGVGTGADAVLVWHMGLAKLLPFVQAPRRAGVFIFLHGVEAWRRLRPAERARLKAARRLLTNSDHTWRRFVELNPEFGAHPHATVSLGLDLAAPAVDAPAGAPAALIVARMAQSEDYKGHRELIDAWRLVRGAVPDAELWIAGDGDLRPTLERYASERAPRGAVRFFGRVSEQEKARLLARCRCLAMPSRGEGFGLVYLEAMAAGKPSLVSVHDAGREVVQPPVAGVAADPTSPNELAAALTSLLAADGASAWSAKVQSHYRGRYTAAHFQQRLVRAVSEAL